MSLLIQEGDLNVYGGEFIFLLFQGGGTDEDLAQAHRAYLAPPMPPRQIMIINDDDSDEEKDDDDDDDGDDDDDDGDDDAIALQYNDLT